MVTEPPAVEDGCEAWPLASREGLSPVTLGCVPEGGALNDTEGFSLMSMSEDALCNCASEFGIASAVLEAAIAPMACGIGASGVDGGDRVVEGGDAAIVPDKKFSST